MTYRIHTERMVYIMNEQRLLGHLLPGEAADMALGLEGWG